MMMSLVVVVVTEWAPVTISFARILSLPVLMLRNEADFVVDEEPFFFLPRVKGTTIQVKPSCDLLARLWT